MIPARSGQSERTFSSAGEVLCSKQNLIERNVVRAMEYLSSKDGGK